MRVPAPDAYRLKKAKGIASRRRGIPVAGRALLAVALVVLGGAVFLTAGDGIGQLARALTSSFSGFVDKIVATPQPSATELIVSGAPVVALPSEPYTNQTTADLQITVPVAEVGNTSARVRVYLTLEGQEPAQVAEVPIGSTVRLVIPVALTLGRNDFYAIIVDGAIESEASPIVTYILDTEPPVFVLTEPQDGGTVNQATVVIAGTTQPRTTLLALNSTNATSISGQTGPEGSFSLELPIEYGVNSISLAGRDPAGNAGELTLSVTRGSGTLTATLTSSATRIATSSLPVSIQLSVLVLDPNGAPLADATVNFTLTIPGIPPIAKDAISGPDGRATFTTTLPSDVTVGSGLATVLVVTDAYGSTSSQKPITIVK